jgi:hypothetical protein
LGFYLFFVIFGRIDGFWVDGFVWVLVDKTNNLSKHTHSASIPKKYNNNTIKNHTSEREFG